MKNWAQQCVRCDRVLVEFEAERDGHLSVSEIRGIFFEAGVEVVEMPRGMMMTADARQERSVPSCTPEVDGVDIT